MHKIVSSMNKLILIDITGRHFRRDKRGSTSFCSSLEERAKQNPLAIDINILRHIISNHLQFPRVQMCGLLVALKYMDLISVQLGK